MAEQIVASRVNTVQEGLKTDLTTLESNLDSEGSSLMPNGNFLSKFNSTVDYVKQWLPTGNGSADKLRLYAADSASKSIGTYVKFNKSASGGSSPYGNNISGIISKAVLNPVELVRSPDNSINSFNIGMRIRGTTLQTSTPPTWTQVYSVGSPTSAYHSNFITGANKTPSNYSWGTMTQTWSQGGNTLSNVPTGLTKTVFNTAVSNVSYGNRRFDGYRGGNTGNYTTFPMHAGSNHQQQVLVLNLSHTTSDTNWSLFLIVTGKPQY